MRILNRTRPVWFVLLSLGVFLSVSAAASPVPVSLPGNAAEELFPEPLAPEASLPSPGPVGEAVDGGQAPVHAPGNCEARGLVPHERVGCHEWQARLNGPGDSHDSPDAITLDEKRDLLIAAGTTRGDAGGEQREISAWHTQNATVAAFDAGTGEERWRYTWDLANDQDRFYAVAVDEDEGLVFTGGYGADESGQWTGILLALDVETGEEVWNQTIASPGHTYVSDLTYTQQDRVLAVLGYHGEDGDRDTHLRSHNAGDGTLAWSLTEGADQDRDETPLRLLADEAGTTAWIGGSASDDAYVQRADLTEPAIDLTVREPSQWGWGLIAHSESRDRVYDLTTSSGTNGDYKVLGYDVDKGGEQSRVLAGVPTDKRNEATDLAVAEEEGILVATGRTLPSSPPLSAWTGTVGIDLETNTVIWTARGPDPPTGVSVPSDLVIPESEECAIVVGNGGDPRLPSRMRVTSLDLATGETLWTAAYSENPWYDPSHATLTASSDGGAVFVAAGQYQMTGNVRPFDPNTATQSDWLLLGYDDPCEARGLAPEV